MSKPPVKSADPTAGMSDHEAEMWRRNNPPKVAPAALPTPGTSGTFTRDPVTGTLTAVADAPPPAAPLSEKEAD